MNGKRGVKVRTRSLGSSPGTWRPHVAPRVFLFKFSFWLGGVIFLRVVQKQQTCGLSRMLLAGRTEWHRNGMGERAGLR